MDIKRDGNILSAQYHLQKTGNLELKASGLFHSKWKIKNIDKSFELFGFNEEELKTFCSQYDLDLIIKHPTNYLDLVDNKPRHSKEILKIPFNIFITISLCVTERGSNFYARNKNIEVINKFKLFLSEYIFSINNTETNHFTVLINAEDILISEDDYSMGNLHLQTLGMAPLKDTDCICGMALIIEELTINILQEQNIFNNIYISASLNMAMKTGKIGSISLNFNLKDPITMNPYTEWR